MGRKVPADDTVIGMATDTVMEAVLITAVVPRIMWPFRKKQTLKESGFFRGFTDWHCHILPDVDDGVQTMDEALQILGDKTEWRVLLVRNNYIRKFVYLSS